MTDRTAKMMHRLVPLALLSLAGCTLASCTEGSLVTSPLVTGSVAESAAWGRHTQAHTIARTVAPEDALVRLPATAGRALEVRRSHTLAGPGSTLVERTEYAAGPRVRGANWLEVRVARRPANVHTATLPVTDAGLARELRAAFPATRMGMNHDLATNAYGAYGTASGRAVGGVACHYAWQELARDRRARRTPASLWRRARGIRPLTLSIRLRLCGLTRAEFTRTLRALNVRGFDETVLAPPDGTATWTSGADTRLGSGQGRVEDAVPIARTPPPEVSAPKATKPRVRRRKVVRTKRRRAVTAVRKARARKPAASYAAVPLPPAGPAPSVGSAPLTRPQPNAVAPPAPPPQLPVPRVLRDA